MILNSQSAELVRANAHRLASSIRSKDDLTDLATAGNYEHVLFAIESLLTNTEMYFDDEMLALLDEATWKNFKSLLMVYTLNIVNRGGRNYDFIRKAQDDSRDFVGATAQV